MPTHTTRAESRGPAPRSLASARRWSFGSVAALLAVWLLLLLAAVLASGAPTRQDADRNRDNVRHGQQSVGGGGPERHKLHRVARAATARLDRLWDDAVIPYEIDSVFTDDRAALFRAAMRHWENFTCVKFVERNPDEHRNYIVFTDRKCGCCSFVGKRGNGAQAISIGKHCDKFGIVVHELGHVVGFWHEHTRPDRDQHVQIIEKNIQEGQEYNFNKLTKDEVNSLGLAYDYDSILHYATNTFARENFLDTILPLHGHLDTEVVSQSPPQQQQQQQQQQPPLSASIQQQFAGGGLIINQPMVATLAPAPATTRNLLVNNQNQNHKQTFNNASSHMINDQPLITMEQRMKLARQQIERDFQSMLEFNVARTSARNNQIQQARAQNHNIMILDGSVVVNLVNQSTSSEKQQQHPGSKRRQLRDTFKLDTDDAEHMLSMDNLLAKTSPEIGQRLRLSVGDIAQTNLLYKCPRCGRTIQQLSGVFHSPSYYASTHQQQAKQRTQTTSYNAPDQSQNNNNQHVELCEWRLTVGLGERIMLNITDLDLAPPGHGSTLGRFGMPKQPLSEGELHDIVESNNNHQFNSNAYSSDPMIMTHCVTDYIEVRDGYTIRSPLIAKLCGHIVALRDVIRPIVSTSNRLLVSYRTSSLSVGKRGFIAQHETICGGYILLGNAPMDQVGSITSSLANVFHTKSIETTTVTSSSRSQTTTSSTTPTQTVTTVANFNSNHRILINGSSPNENEVLLNSQTNSIRFNSFQSQQPQQVGTNYTLSTPHTTSHSTSTTDATIGTSASTTTSSSGTPTSRSNFGWNLWPVINASFIQSPNWPEQYRPSRECLWQIRAEENHQISMRFDAFDLEPHDSCAYDYIEIRDGDAMDNDLIGRFCGNRMPEQILSSGQSMMVKFVSDSDVNKGGFFATLQSELNECKLGTHGCSYKCSDAVSPYRCECPNGLELAPDGKNCVPTCGGIRNDSSGQITSPSFPDLYPISTRCIWEIHAPPHHRITLNFTHFDLEGIKLQECDYDYVDIWSKMGDGKYVKNGIFCGVNPPFAVASIANVMRIEFNSDNSIQKSGFQANYIIDQDECATNNGGCQHICINNIGSYKCSCNNGFVLHENKHDCIGSHCLYSIISPEGTFHSPNFPSPYPPNKECAWVFSTAPGHRIKLIFDQFDLENHQECAYDHVAVFDGESMDDHALGRFCGSRRPLTLVSSFNLMYLLFRSDATNEKRGFNSTHSTVCGGRLQANLNQNDLIYSHPLFDGATHYNRNEDCDWIIEANENQRVRIEFTFFALEADSNCNYDQTIVYDGPDDAAPQLARLCGTDLPKEQMRMKSSGESMLIVFKSDDSINSKGFSLTYTAIESGEDEPVAITSYPTGGS